MLSSGGQKRSAASLSLSDGEANAVALKAERVLQSKRSKNTVNTSVALASSSSSHPQERVSSSPYRVGSILKITLHNFMTHKDISFRPGPRLNVVLGPNGTGKSSIVSAIAIGLGFAHGSILDRGEDVAGYVRRGAKEGYVEIELQGPGRTTKTIRRAINAEDNTSEWWLDRIRARKADVITVIREFNIQLNNLTQFLPQEKVAQFAAISNEERLKQTEEAVLEPEVAALHEKLIQLRKTHKQQSAKLKTQTTALENEKSKNEGIQREVERMHQRRELVDQIELMECKVLSLKHADKLAYGVELQDQEAELNDAIRKKQEERDPNAQRLAELQHQQKEITNVLQQRKVEVQIKALDQKRQQLYEVEIQMHSLEKEMQSAQSRVAEAEQRKELKVAALNRAEQDYQLLLQSRPPTLPQSLQSVDAEILAVEAELLKEEEEDDLKSEAVLKAQALVRTAQDVRASFHNARSQRLSALKRINSHAVSAWNCVEANRERLSGEPIFFVPLEVQVPNAILAGFLETQLPNYAMTAIICTNRNDKDFLVKEFRAKRYDISCVYHPLEAEGVHFPRPYDFSRVAPYGFEGWLDSAFTASSTVKAFLNDVGYICSTIYTRRDGRDIDLDHMVATTPVRSFFTRDSQHVSKASRYNSSVKSTRVNDVHPARLWIGPDTTQMEEADANLHKAEQDFREAMAAKQRSEAQVLRCRERREALRIERTHFLAFGNREKAARDKIGRLKRDADEAAAACEGLNVEEQKHQISETIWQAQVKAGDIVSTMAIEMERIVELSVEYDAHALRLKKLDSGIFEAQQSQIQQRHALSHQEKLLEKLQENINHVWADMQELKADFMDRKAKCIEKYGTLEAFSEKWRTLPDDAMELVELMATAKARAETISENESIMAEYEAREKTIAEMKDKVDALQKEVDDIEKAQAKAKAKWLPPLKAKVDIIAQNFKENCQNCGIAGDVVLCETGEDYDKYALKILVRFRRGEPLKDLDAQRQSGGERSVSTILYLLALQKLNCCPLRVIDEINQGMDPINERKVFEQLVKSSSAQEGEEKSVPQCFLITPKLLHNLIPNTKDVTVLFVFNGPFNASQRDWDIAAAGLKRRSRNHVSSAAASSASAGTSRHMIEEE